MVIMKFQSNRKEFKAEYKRAKDITLNKIGKFVHGETVLRCPVGQYPKGSGRVGGNLRNSYDYRPD